MKKMLLITFAMLLSNNLLAADVSLQSKKELGMQLATMPLAFTANCGQWDESVKFCASSGGVTMWFASDRVYYQFFKRETKSSNTHSILETRGLPEDNCDSILTMVISSVFLGANPHPQIAGEDLMQYKCNYFIGNNPSNWYADVSNYRAVVYRGIYPGIDLKFYGNGDGKIEYDFMVEPGADPSQIAMQYDGAQAVCVNDIGNLVVDTEWGAVTEQLPSVYQVVDGKHRELKATCYQRSTNCFAYCLSGDYNPNYAVVIDPTLSYSTYLGGNNGDEGYSIAVDSSGSAYITGSTGSTNFPVINPNQSFHGQLDVFVTKFSSTGSSAIFSTYLGGSDLDWSNMGAGIAVDNSGAVYLTGRTYSTNFPTANPFQASHGGYTDAFVTKLSSSGNSLVYSTYLGGLSSEDGTDIAVDQFGSAYVTGQTSSTNFPTVNPYQTGPAGAAFVTKFSSSGSSLIYSTYLGGNNIDQGLAIAVDGSGSAYVAGSTGSTDFPTLSAIQPSNSGDYTGFVSKLASSGSSLEFSTYLGGSGVDQVNGIDVDQGGSIYVCGYTQSSDFPTHLPYQSTLKGVSDAFLAKITGPDYQMAFSTFLGGADYDGFSSVAIDDSGAIYLTGYSFSSDYPTLNSFEPDHSGNDAVVTKFNPCGSGIVYSTFGGSSEGGADIAVDQYGAAYVTGSTLSSAFPTQNPFQGDQPISDAFVFKIDPVTPVLVAGDGNSDGTVNVSDVVYLIAYIFGGRPAPCPYAAGDANCSGAVSISDAVYLIKYIFAGGPAPC